MTVILGLFSGPSLLSFQLSTSLPPSMKSNPTADVTEKQHAVDGFRDGGRGGRRGSQAGLFLQAVYIWLQGREKDGKDSKCACIICSLFLGWHQKGKRSKDKCKDQTERNLSLTCQHEDKKKEDRSPSPPLSCTCLFLKDIQSRAERQLRRCLSACPVTVSRAERRGEMSVQCSRPIQGLDQGCSTARCCHWWKPHLHPHPPPSGRWRAFHFDKDSLGVGGGYLEVQFDYRGITESFGQPGHWRCWVCAKLSDLWSSYNLKGRALGLHFCCLTTLTWCSYLRLVSLRIIPVYYNLDLILVV